MQYGALEVQWFLCIAAQEPFSPANRQTTRMPSEIEWKMCPVKHDTSAIYKRIHTGQDLRNELLKLRL